MDHRFQVESRVLPPSYYVTEVFCLSKKDFLVGNGTYNKHYEKVKSARFIDDGFFDPMDIVQVKYEMLKEVMRDGKAVTDAADDFGFSRTAYYSIKDAFDKHGVSGLTPEKPGPKKPRKLTPKYQTQIDEYIARKPGISSGELAVILNKKGDITVSRRTIERYRAKKKQR
jgi:transposase